MKINYRPELDGIRAIAIIAVIFYHLKFTVYDLKIFSGGFLGVDIFFVISGYIITSLILKELDQNRSFSFVNFYLRRARRILPVLYLVILVSIPIVLFFLRPADVVNFSSSILYSLVFLSNYYFYKNTTAYGDELSLDIPFLHTWTLSIEEQFYLVLPIFFFIVYKFYKTKIFTFLAILIFLSLVFSQWASLYHHIFNFYFSLSRAWELLVGTLTAYIHYKKKIKYKKYSNEINSFLGLVLIFFSFFFFKTESAHPSFFTLIPIIGTCLIIFFIDKKTFMYRFLSNRVLVFIGLISYSLYLWHYPLISFVRILEFNFNNFIVKILILGLVFFLSLLSFFFVEKKFRNKNTISTKSFLIIIFLLTIFINIFLIYSYKSNGFNNRYIIDSFNVDNYSYSKHAISFQNQIKKENFFKNDNKIKVLVIGNSHAEDTMMLFYNSPYLLKEYQFKIERVQISDFFQLIKSKNYSQNFIDADVLLFSSMWFQDDLAIIQDLISALKVFKKKIIITTNTPEFSVEKIKFKNTNLINVSMYSEFIIRNEKIPTKIDLIDLEKKYFLDLEHNKKVKKINDYLFSLAKKNNIKILDKTDYVCSRQYSSCDVLTDKNELIIYDHSHYSLEGAKYFAKKIEKLNWFKVN